MTSEKQHTFMMKKLLAMIAGAATLGCAQAQSEPAAPANSGKVLVVYFSATGTTADAAKKLAQVTNGTLHAITPKLPYSSADLDWRDHKSRCYVEMHDPASRPEISSTVTGIEDYDTVYIGFPIWWDTYPSIIATFIEAHQLQGKTLVPFATSGGSGISTSVSNLKKNYPELTWKKGLLLNGADVQRIHDLIK